MPVATIQEYHLLPVSNVIQILRIFSITGTMGRKAGSDIPSVPDGITGRNEIEKRRPPSEVQAIAKEIKRSVWIKAITKATLQTWAHAMSHRLIGRVGKV